MKKTLKKWGVTILFVILAFSYSICANAQTQKQKAIKAYLNYMTKQPSKNWGIPVRFSLAYINNDSIPELIKIQAEEGLQVYTYTGGKIKQLKHNLGAEAYSIAYYPKKGIFRITGGTLIPCHRYYKMNGGKISLLFCCDEMVEGNYYYKYSSGKEVKLSKNSSQKILKKYVGNVKIQQCKYYNNTASNRKKYLTETAIVPSIKLNKSKGTVYAGKSIQLKAKVTGKASKITWKSGNKKIATVNSKGKVIGKREGITTITATANGKTAKFKITVKPRIKLNKSKGTVYVGKTIRLKATVNGTSKKVTWKSGNKKIATVNSKGKVTGKKAGTTVITANVNGSTAQFKVTVKRK